jgi:plastocyanin
MLHRFWRPAVCAMLVLALAAVGGTAVAKSKKAPNKATVTMKSPVKFKRNKFIQDGSRFLPGTVLIRSGGTLTLKNKSDQPHTFSIVTKKDQPRNLRQLGNCDTPNGACTKIGVAHQIDQDGNVTKPIVDVGAAGIDQVGDSIALNPKQTQKVNLSAKKGTLYFLCAIHAWMSGELKVR